jgi:hypothetical protein
MLRTPTLIAAALLLLSAGSALAELKNYPIEPLKLPDIDDGTGPLKFDFRPYKLASRFDGSECRFSIRRFVEKVEEIGKGTFSIKGGHLNFDRAVWLTGGDATPETYKRANLALTENAELVGRLPVFNLFLEPGMVTPEPHMVTVRTKDGKLGKTDLVGSVKLAIEPGMQGEFAVLDCTPGQ